MMRIMVKKAISTILIFQGVIFITLLVSFTLYINLQIAFLSSFFIILGSIYSYKKMVNKQVDINFVDAKRDILDEIEDPHELYENYEINNTPAEELNLKEIVKEEKAKIKTFSLSSIKHGAKGSTSLFRLLPYLFLVLGFIALKNNELLNIAIYLPSLLVGIIAGSLSGKSLFS